MEPKIVTRDEFKVVGIQYIGQRGSDEFPKLWNRFMPLMSNVANWVEPQVSYGASFDHEDPEKLRYIACREVSDLDNVPEGMVGETVPGGTFAVFTHTGPVDTLNETYDLIYGTWLPAAGIETDTFYDFERYDLRFNNSETSIMEIWIPIR